MLVAVESHEGRCFRKITYHCYYLYNKTSLHNSYTNIADTHPSSTCQAWPSLAWVIYPQNLIQRKDQKEKNQKMITDSVPNRKSTQESLCSAPHTLEAEMLVYNLRSREFIHLTNSDQIHTIEYICLDGWGWVIC